MWVLLVEETFDVRLVLAEDPVRLDAWDRRVLESNRCILGVLEFAGLLQRRGENPHLSSPGSPMKEERVWESLVVLLRPSQVDHEIAAEKFSQYLRQVRSAERRHETPRSRDQIPGESRALERLVVVVSHSGILRDHA